MRTAKRLALLGSLTFGAMAVGLVPALADSASYTGPGVVAGCSFSVGTVTVPSFGAGGACFVVPPGATRATISATDDLTGPPALEVGFPGSVAAGTLLCNGSGSVVVSGQPRLFVGTSNTAASIWSCGRASVPTRGTITVSFT